MQDVEDIYELSPMQQGMLFHSLFAPRAGFYCQQLKSTLRGRLDVETFRRTWQRVVERHAVFRTAFHWEEVQKPLQVVRRSATLPWLYEDWRELSPSEQEARFEAYMADDLARGYDFATPPLMRLALFRTGEETHRFVWSFHHLLMDGWCLPLVLREVFIFYEGALAGADVRLRAPRPYREYIGWLQRQDMAQAEAFWRESLRGFTEPTPVTRGTAAAAVGEAEAGGFREREVTLPADVYARLNAYARKHQLTLNTLVQGAWAVLLSRYGGIKDVVFGATVSGRPTTLPGAEAMVGLFINSLPVRVRLDGPGPIADELRHLRDWLAELRQYEHTPLVEAHGWSEVPRTQPLFESLVVFENYPVDPAMAEQLRSISVSDAHSGNVNNFPVTLIALPGPSALTLRLKYDGRRLDEQTAARMLGHLQTILRAMTRGEAGRLFDLPVLTPAEQQQAVVEWNDTRRDYGPGVCAHELFERHAALKPEAPAAVFEGECLTYGELNERANRLARYLRSRGVGPDVLVGLFMRRSLETVVGMLGILKAGGAYFPLDPGFPPQRLAFMLEDSRARHILTAGSHAETLPPGSDLEVLRLDADWHLVADYAGDNLASNASPANAAYVIYTSGSTGRPKGVVVEHRQIVNYVRGVSERLSFEPGLSYAMVQPLTVDSCKTVVFPALCMGGCLHLIEQERSTDPHALADYFRRHHIDVLKITPSHLAALQGEAAEARVLPRGWLVLGGEASQSRWVEGLQELSPDCRIFNHYGPTETTVGVLTYPLRPERVGTHGALLPTGRPVPNVQAYLLDEALRPVPVGVPGELYIGGDSVARGYLGRPALTAERFVPDPFETNYGGRLYRTGDLARYLPGGEIEFIGRGDDQVKIRGYRIELKEIETVCCEHPAVKETVVLARKDAVGGGKLTAYVVAREGHGVASAELRAFLGERLPDYMLPSAFVFLDAIPLMAHGKVNRQALPEPGLEAAAGGDYEGPRTPLEAKLAEVFAQVIGVERVGVADNFFELGGHSLMVTSLLFRLHETFRVELPLRTVFEAPTVAQLAPALVESCAVRVDEAELDRILSEIEQLSEDEAQWILAN
jgi:amino acid adenylation domain-containing protein